MDGNGQRQAVVGPNSSGQTRIGQVKEVSP